MLIEIWSDIACPFCYLGLTKLHQAIKNLNLQDEVRMNQIKTDHLDLAIHGAREVEAFEWALGVDSAT